MMNEKTLGWIEIVGGVLSLIYSGGTISGPYGGMYAMMARMMGTSGGLSVTILSVLFILAGIWHLNRKH